MWRGPISVYAAIAFAVLAVYLAFEFDQRYLWTPLQREYLSSYIASSLKTELELGPSEYLLLYSPRTNQRALEGQLEGAEWRRITDAQPAMRAFFQTSVYGNRSLLSLATVPLSAGLVALLFGLVVAIPKDSKRLQERRTGKHLQGVDLLAPSAFNKRFGGGGVPLQCDGPTVVLPASLETYGTLVMGDVGTGKSTLFKHYLAHVERHQQTAVVFDAHSEFLPLFFDESRGDRVLNGLERRMFYWSPSLEWDTPEEAFTVAESMFPGMGSERHAFFDHTARNIFAHLIQLPGHDGERVSPQELAHWISNEGAFDARLKGTDLWHFVSPAAKAQRIAVLSTLALITPMLRMLPHRDETAGEFSIKEWAKTRRGWLFFTSTVNTMGRQRPVISMWLDTVLLRLMSTPHAGLPQVTIVLDEIPTLNKMPQLHTAVTGIRKFNAGLVLGFQARKSLEALYGEEQATAMLSQPATKIFLRTSEYESAEWVSKTIAQVQLQTITQSRNEGILQPGDPNYRMETQDRPLVMTATIQGLAERCGFVKCINGVTPLTRLQYLAPPTLVPAFIPRPRRSPTAMPVLTAAPRFITETVPEPVSETAFIS